MLSQMDEDEMEEYFMAQEDDQFSFGGAFKKFMSNPMGAINSAMKCGKHAYASFNKMKDATGM